VLQMHPLSLLQLIESARIIRLDKVAHNQQQPRDFNSDSDSDSDSDCILLKCQPIQQDYM